MEIGAFNKIKKFTLKNNTDRPHFSTVPIYDKKKYKYFF